MHALVALALFFITGVMLVAALWAARWIAGLAFGRRNILDAMRPWSDVGYPMALTRAFAGTIGWYLCASLLVTVPLFIGGEERPDETSMRVRVIGFGPASRAGLVDGDRIIRVDGAPVHDWQTLIRSTASHASTPAHVEVERNGAIVAFDVLPENGKIRVVPPVEHVDVGLGAAIARGLAAPAGVLVVVSKNLLRILSGADRVDASGPVGIVRYAGASPLFVDAVRAAYALPLIFLVSLGLIFTARRKG